MTGFHNWAARKLLACLAIAGLLGAVPAQAANSGEAEKLRRLDIMLMVTGLRCRMTGANFQADFAAFEALHMADLNGAAQELRSGLTGTYGKGGADRALDRLSTIIANQYGSGHPRLGCADLKAATRLLAVTPGRKALIVAADELLGEGAGGIRLALSQR